jgi:hypothetical protein
MSLYQVYFAGMSHSSRHLFYDGWETTSKTPAVNEWQMLRETLENSQHSFVFIITKNQWANWEAKRDTYKLDEFTAFEMPYFVSNRRYPTEMYGRKLRLVILKGKGNDES